MLVQYAFDKGLFSTGILMPRSQKNQAEMLNTICFVFEVGF